MIDKIMAASAGIGVFYADQHYKDEMEKELKPGEQKELFGGKIQLRKVYNKGATLNFLEDSPELVKGLSIGATGAFVLMYLPVFFKKGNLIPTIGGGLMLGGAASNIYDRIERGKVVDYIAFPLQNKKLARITYNIGDFAIALGALSMICRRNKHNSK